jgi:hypothetical protein
MKAKQKAASRKSSRISTYANAQPRPMHCPLALLATLQGNDLANASDSAPTFFTS